MANSPPRPCWNRPASNRWLGAVALLLCASSALAGEQAAAPGLIPLQLEVTINGQPTNLIAEFFQLPDSRIAAKPEELGAIGIKVPEGFDEDVVPLSEIPGLRYNYNFARQSIDIAVTDMLRQLQVLNAQTDSGYNPPERTFGAFVNYTAFLSGGYAGANGQINGGSLSVDGHVFGRLGTLSQSGIIGTTTSKQMSVLRLDSTWSYSDPEKIISYRAGDVITGGLTWTRPMRIGGIQVQRDFSLRPNLITMPLPSVSGTAALPSTLDVYVGNAKTYSTEIPSGPYRIDNIPVVSGAGTARLVVTDTTGRQVQSETPFFTDFRLMRKGLFSYSVEAGFPRLDFGVHSSTYEGSLVVTGSFRAGLSDEISLEGHTELGQGLINGGAGVVFSVGQLGLVSAATSISSKGSDTGALVYGGWYLPFGNFSLQATMQRTMGEYRDLASLPVNSGGPLPVGLNVPRAIDQLAMGYRFPDSKTSVSLAAIHLDRALEPKSTILTASFTRSFDNGMSIFATAFRDLDDKNAAGVFAGIAIPLGPSLSSFAGLTHDKNGTSATADLQKSIGTEPGSYGGRLSIAEGANPFVSGYGAVKLQGGVLEGSLTQHRSAVDGYAAFSGALVAAGKGLFIAQRIDDAFVVVDAGAPGVKVLLENHPVGVTGSGGELLVTGLRSYQKNKISIDALDLPVDDEVPNTVLRVVPAERSGAIARFAIEQSAPSAEVIFTDANGSFVDPGTHGTLLGANQPFVVGYEGRAFIKNLKPENTVAIDLQSGPCEATFTFEQKPSTLVTIGPIACR